MINCSNLLSVVKLDIDIDNTSESNTSTSMYYISFLLVVNFDFKMSDSNSLSSVSELVDGILIGKNKNYLILNDVDLQMKIK